MKWPRLALLISAVCLVPLLVSTVRLEIRPDARILLEGDARNLAAYEKVESILNQDTVLIISMSGGDLFSQRGFDDLRGLCDQLSLLQGVVDVKSLTHSVKPVRRGLAFEMVPFIPEGPVAAGDIENIRRFCVEHPLVRNVMVSADGRHFLITAHLQRNFSNESDRRALREEVSVLLRQAEAKGYQFQIIAMPLVEEEVQRTLRSDLKVIAWVAGAASLAMLGLTARSWALLAGTGCNLLLAMAGFAGWMHVFGVTVTLYTAMLFPLMAAVQLTLLVHVITAVQSMSLEGHESGALVGAAAGRVFKSSAFATLTTAIGLVSFMACDIPELGRLGRAGAMGLAWVFAWSFGPGLSVYALLLRCERPEARPHKLHSLPVQKWPHALATLVLRQRTKILGCGALATLFAAVSLPFIRTDIRVAEFLSPTSPTRQALEEMNLVYGGINIVQLDIDTGRNQGVVDLELLQRIKGIEMYAAAQPGVSGVYSFGQLLAMMNQIWEQEKPGSLKLPDSPLMLNLFVSALRARNYPFLTALADEELRQTHLVIRSRDMPSGQYLEVVQSILSHARSVVPGGVMVSAREGIHSILEADRRVFRAQWDTALLTLGAIWLTLTMLWRSAWLGLAAITVNVLPVGITLGLSSMMGSPLNSVTVMVAALVMGIGVDDAVHWITEWRDDLLKSPDAKSALITVLKTKGPPILASSAMLLAVFLPFALFSFPPLRNFGLMASIGFIASCMGVLTLLPALLGNRD